MRTHNPRQCVLLTWPLYSKPSLPQYIDSLIMMMKHAAELGWFLDCGRFPNSSGYLRVQGSTSRFHWGISSISRVGFGVVHLRPNIAPLYIMSNAAPSALSICSCDRSHTLNSQTGAHQPSCPTVACDCDRNHGWQSQCSCRCADYLACSFCMSGDPDNPPTGVHHPSCPQLPYVPSKLG